MQPNTVSVDKTTGCLGLPRTYLTRKGPLLLFTAPENTSEKKQPPQTLPKKLNQQKLIDLSLKLGTLERLTLSVLQYGDMNFDRENCSVTDKENRWVLKFLHDLDKNESNASQPMVDRHVQPGEDLRFYLRDLKQRASTRAYGQERCLSSRARSQELREILQQLEDALPLSCSQPASQPPACHADGSQSSLDEFFYSYSPISSESFRTHHQQEYCPVAS
ncbi:uncharacterized protein LOC112565850 [Pomacea canaliculata]|uniref:uncharacterized protein LOC112565850 n=1 Tax=Pomacea canaliculata TaxID=400727 RepID=UPI000D73C9A5|nr:uncharacterized protein LOC112565850 [Pomacea canaliculata]